MEEQNMLEIPEDHVFTKSGAPEGTGSGFAVSGLVDVLPPLKQTQFREVLVVSGFDDNTDLLEVVVSPNVVTRIWMFHAVSEYVKRGAAHGPS